MSHTILKCIQCSGIYYFHGVLQLSPSSSSKTFSSPQEEAPEDLALPPQSFPPPLLSPLATTSVNLYETISVS